MGTETLAKAKKLVGEVGVGNLATNEDGQPRVRPIAMQWVGDCGIWFATHAGSRKVAQLEADPAVEISFNDAQWNHVRLNGQASMSRDDAERGKLLQLIPQLAEHFAGPTDPNYLLVKVAIKGIEYMQMGSIEYETCEL